MDSLRLLLVWGVPSAFAWISLRACLSFFPDGNGNLNDTGQIVAVGGFILALGLIVYFDRKTRLW